MAVPATRRPKIVTVNKDREEELKKVSELHRPVVFAELVERRVCSLLHGSNSEKQRELANTTGSAPRNGGNSSRP